MDEEQEVEEEGLYGPSTEAESEGTLPDLSSDEVTAVLEGIEARPQGQVIKAATQKKAAKVPCYMAKEEKAKKSVEVTNISRRI